MYDDLLILIIAALFFVFDKSCGSVKYEEQRSNN